MPLISFKTINVQLWRQLQRRANGNALQRHVQAITKEVMSQVQGWRFTKRKFSDPIPKKESWWYRLDLQLQQTDDKATSILGVRVALNAARLSPRFGANSYIWEDAPTDQEIKRWRSEATVEVLDAKEPKVDLLLPHQIAIPSEFLKRDGRDHIDKHPAFRGIYGRSAHIRRILVAINAFRHSAKVGLAPGADIDLSRNHVLLWGPPAGGKSRIMRGLRRMLPAGAYDRLDAPSCTKAGIISLFQGKYRKQCPPIFFVEEIEKLPLDGLINWLQILDERAEITKLNFFIDDQLKVPFLCIATCNDKKYLESVLKGALGSRFGHQIYVPRPNRQEMELILLDRVREVRGNTKWVKVCLEFMEIFGTNDPREVKGWLDYQGFLLDGTAELELREMHEREQQDNRHKAFVNIEMSDKEVAMAECQAGSRYTDSLSDKEVAMAECQAGSRYTDSLSAFYQKNKVASNGRSK